MAEKSGFFDAHYVNGEYDRVYLAEHFARYFASFIGNGIFGGKSNELMVREKEPASMGIRVLSGQAWIDGYWYENDGEHSLAIDVADGVLHRIDSIMVRWIHAERTIRLAVRKGTAAVNPSAPSVQRNDDFYELKLADVSVRAGTTKITQADITDKRYNTDVCGLVVGVVQQLDPDEFGIQLDTYIQEFMSEHDSWKNATQSDIEQWVTNFKTQCTNWYNQFVADSTSSFNTFMTNSQQRVDKLVSDGQTNIDNVASTGEAKLNKTASDGQAAIDNVVQTGSTNIANVVSTGQQNINKLLTEGQQAMNSAMEQGAAKVQALVDEKTALVDQIIEENRARADEIIEYGRQRFDNAMTELEQIAEESDAATLILDVADLKNETAEMEEDIENVKAISVESTQFPGCFYRIVNGIMEWINPPTMPGVEYATTERWNNKPVYVKTIYLGALSNKAVITITIDAEYDKVFFVSGYAFDPENNMSHPFPITRNGLTPVAVISGIEGNGSESNIIINVNDDLSAFSGYITVKYVKF